VKDVVREPATGRAAFGAQLGFIDVLPARSAARVRADQDDARSDDQDEKERTKAMVEVKKREIPSMRWSCSWPTGAKSEPATDVVEGLAATLRFR
jgi:hypothetical protein